MEGFPSLVFSVTVFSKAHCKENHPKRFRRRLWVKCITHIVWYNILVLPTDPVSLHLWDMSIVKSLVFFTVLNLRIPFVLQELPHWAINMFFCSFFSAENMVHVTPNISEVLKHKPLKIKLLCQKISFHLEYSKTKGCQSRFCMPRSGTK